VEIANRVFRPDKEEIRLTLARVVEVRRAAVELK
jgi:hypothetical protein